MRNANPMISRSSLVGQDRPLYSRAFWDAAILDAQDSQGGPLIGPAKAQYAVTTIREAVMQHNDAKTAEAAIEVCSAMVVNALIRQERGRAVQERVAHTAETRFCQNLLANYGLGASGTIERLVHGCQTLCGALAADPEDNCEMSSPR